MAALGFTFRVLPDVWLMHWPHRPQAAWAAHPYTKYHGISKHNIERDAREAMLEVGAGMGQEALLRLHARKCFRTCWYVAWPTRQGGLWNLDYGERDAVLYRS